eukprot:4414860-Pleurochrysis_carterae.AAC.1
MGIVRGVSGVHMVDCCREATRRLALHPAAAARPAARAVAAGRICAEYGIHAECLRSEIQPRCVTRAQCHR